MREGESKREREGVTKAMIMDLFLFLPGLPCHDLHKINHLHYLYLCRVRIFQRSAAALIPVLQEGVCTAVSALNSCMILHLQKG